ncbi:MAG: carbon-nitrogen hydrolase [Planctomycetes bacterium]|nr:carbon-nitrogen hydrolase [Planctomycetota bacterium]
MSSPGGERSVGGRPTVRIGLVQSACTPDREANVTQALDGVAAAAAQGAEVVCLQELFAGHYPCQDEDHGRFAEAEGVPGPLTQRLAAAARAHRVVVVGSVFERRTPGLFHNTAVIFESDGSVRGTYRKMHIPDDPHYYEKFYFAPGDTGFMSVPTSKLAVGPLVCWDQWYPEAARLTALAGADALFYPTAIGWLDGEEALHAEQYESWDTMLRSHAIANGTFVVAVNRTGREGNLRFWGASVVYAPNGACLAKASHDRPETFVVDCDLGRIEWSRTRWPFFRDRRIDAYGGLTARWGH